MNKQKRIWFESLKETLSFINSQSEVNVTNIMRVCNLSHDGWLEKRDQLISNKWVTFRAEKEGSNRLYFSITNEGLIVLNELKMFMTKYQYIKRYKGDDD